MSLKGKCSHSCPVGQECARPRTHGDHGHSGACEGRGRPDAALPDAPFGRSMRTIPADTVFGAVFRRCHRARFWACRHCCTPPPDAALVCGPVVAGSVSAAIRLLSGVVPATCPTSALPSAGTASHAFPFSRRVQLQENAIWDTSKRSERYGAVMGILLE